MTHTPLLEKHNDRCGLALYFHNVQEGKSARFLLFMLPVV